jgi:tetratricopeptide (TPR) repeat protein
MATISTNQNFLKAKRYLKAGDVAAARAIFEEILFHFPHNARARNELEKLMGGASNTEVIAFEKLETNLTQLFQMRMFDQVKQIAAKFLNPSSNNYKLWNIYGAANLELGDLELAKNAFTNVVRLNPQNLEGHINLGSVERDLGNADAAIPAYLSALQINPKSFAANFYLAKTLFDQKNYSDAETYFCAAVDTNPQHPEAWFLTGSNFRRQGKLVEALKCFRTSADIEPNFPQAQSALGCTLMDAGALEEAEQVFRMSIKSGIGKEAAYYNLAHVHLHRGEYEASIDCCKQALACDPDFFRANYSLAVIYLTLGKLVEGYHYYETRWNQPSEIGKYLNTPKPKWRSQSNHDVFVWSEQGVGDEIMFASMFSEFKDKVKGLQIECDTRLVPLFERSFENDISFTAKGTAVSQNAYDSHLPVGDLMSILRPSMADFEATPAKYLEADQALTQDLRCRLTKNSADIVIGVSWKSGKEEPNIFRHRNLDLGQLVSRLDLPNVKIVNLQYGSCENEIERVRQELGIEIISFPEINNFENIDGLAALMSACDHIISAYNLNLHIAGGLGIPTSALLPMTSDWRWAHQTQMCHWHPSVKLYRRQNTLDWIHPVNECIDDIFAKFELM